jgi:hypothetical protein
MTDLPSIGEARLCPRCHELTLTVASVYKGNPDDEDPYMRQPIVTWRCQCGYGEHQ